MQTLFRSGNRIHNILARKSVNLHNPTHVIEYTHALLCSETRFMTDHRSIGHGKVPIHHFANGVPHIRNDVGTLLSHSNFK